MIFADAIVVPIESNVPDPMETILDAPMLGSGFQDLLGIGPQTRNVEASCNGFLTSHDPSAHNHDNALPVSPFVDLSYVF
jgi:hypothetical protein